MAELTTDKIFDGTIHEVFTGIRQYDKYPKYLPGVTSTKVLEPQKEGSVCQVRYDLKFIRSFFYTLNMYEEPPGRIWWDLDESNIMKVSTGSWALSEQGNDKTKAVYSLDVAFAGLVPQKVVDQVTKANLPMMMDGFQKLIYDTKKEQG